MPEIHQIVTGLDLSDQGEPSPGSRLALELSEWIARRWSAALTLVHSHRADENEETYRLAGTAARLDRSKRVAEAQARLETQGLETRTVETEETPWLAICLEAEARAADLVIAGKRTSHGHDGRKLGSVSFNLLRHAACPVWVVKPGMPALPERILAATDRSAVGEKVVAWAVALAQASGAELHLVHSLQLPMQVQMEGADAEEEWLARTRAEVRQEIEAQVEAAGFAGEAAVHVGLTSPTHAVLECLERLSPELIVMGTVSRGGVAGLVLGNTAERLLGRVECSILAVKPDDFVSPLRR